MHPCLKHLRRHPGQYPFDLLFRRQTLSESSAGHPCYELFHQRMTPCPDCPVQKLSSEGSEYIACELSNWDKERPTTTRACNLHWNKNENDPPLAMVIQEPF